MTRYYCKDCGAVLSPDELKDEKQPYGEGCGYDLWEYVSHCPECGSTDLTEAVQCPVCGEWHDPDDGELCPDCKKDITALWLDLMSDLPNDADPGAVAEYIAEVLV